MDRELQAMRLVNQFLTPFAGVLVLTGVWLAAPRDQSSWLALGILAVTATLNVLTIRMAGARPERIKDIRNLRLVANHFLNVWLIWLLLPYWSPIWMLFLLTMIAVGTYEGWKETISQAVLLGGLLALVAYFRGVSGALAWGQVAVQVATLAWLGLFTNRLAAQLRA